MIPASDIAAARAMLPQVLPTKLKRIARNLRLGLCPIHNEKTPSFYVYEDDWHFHCFGCGAHGDAISWVQRTKGLAFAEAIGELLGTNSASGRQQWRGAAEHSRSSSPPPSDHGAPGILARVAELWAEATAPRVADFYLRSRGIALKSLPEALRGHKRVWCKEAGEYRRAMVAAVTGPSGEITAIQRTYLAESLNYDGWTVYEKGARAADLSAGKKCLGRLGGGAVKLAVAGEVLGIAESVEDALAAARLYRLPTWATCGAQRLGAVELPSCVKHVVLFGDNDLPGRAAAAKAARQYQKRGYNCQCEYPELKDFAEMMQ